MNILRQKKVGFLGAGSLSEAIIDALISSQTLAAPQILVSNRSDKKSHKLTELYGVVTCANNEELIEQSDVIILGTKPQDLFQAIEPIAMLFQPHHVVVSLAAGISTQALRKVLTQVSALVRVMPNSPVRVQKGVIGYCLAAKSGPVEGLIESLFKPLGYVVKADEGEMFDGLTVACASGTGFVLEFMQYWQDWIEDYGFDEETARKMTVETFLGAAALTQKLSEKPFVELQAQVVSKKGGTEAGLESMRELEIERVLRYSFEKAFLRYQEFGRKQPGNDRSI